MIDAVVTPRSCVKLYKLNLNNADQWACLQFYCILLNWVFVSIFSATAIFSQIEEVEFYSSEFTGLSDHVADSQ